MLLGLKITVYNIAIRPPNVLKGTLDYNFHIFLRTISLYLIFVLLLGRHTKYPLRLFTPPPFYKTLITLTY